MLGYKRARRTRTLAFLGTGGKGRGVRKLFGYREKKIEGSRITGLHKKVLKHGRGISTIKYQNGKPAFLRLTAFRGCKGKKRM